MLIVFLVIFLSINGFAEEIIFSKSSSDKNYVFGDKATKFVVKIGGSLKENWESGNENKFLDSFTVVKEENKLKSIKLELNEEKYGEENTVSIPVLAKQEIEITQTEYGIKVKVKVKSRSLTGTIGKEEIKELQKALEDSNIARKLEGYESQEVYGFTYFIHPSRSVFLVVNNIKPKNAKKEEKVEKVVAVVESEVPVVAETSGDSDGVTIAQVEEGTEVKVGYGTISVESRGKIVVLELRLFRKKIRLYIMLGVILGQKDLMLLRQNLLNC